MKELTAYEYDELLTGGQKARLDNRKVDELLALQERDGRPFCQPIRNGVKLTQFVGVIRTASLQLQILPKTSRGTDEKISLKALLCLLHHTGNIQIDHITDANVNNCNTVLDLLLWAYCRELEILMHKGLIKRYRQQQENTTALKGRLLVTQQVRHNLVHAERFYTQHSIYDRQHPANQVLLAALCAVPRLASSSSLAARAHRLTWDYPEIAVPGRALPLFDRIKYDRKLNDYDQALYFARLILSSLHPDLSRGKNDSMALLFDMNSLFEAYVTTHLKRYDGFEVYSQRGARLWEASSNTNVFLGQTYDLLIKRNGRAVAVLDTKWKMPQPTDKPSPHDLRQIFAYLHQWQCPHGMLLYPCHSRQLETTFQQGFYLAPGLARTCSRGWLNIMEPENDAAPYSPKYLNTAWVSQLAGALESLEKGNKLPASWSSQA